MKPEIGKRLDAYGAIRPVVKDDRHVRVSNAFMEWLTTAPAGNASSPGWKNDVLVVYVNMRNQGAAWRWTARNVAKELEHRGFKIGRERVQKALKMLKDHGWTRAVVVKKSGEEAVTEFLEVQWRQLPVQERRTKRFVRIDAIDGIHVFEDDGREVPKSGFAPSRFISKEKQEELDQRHAGRRKMRKATHSADDPVSGIPEHRSPGHRELGEEYIEPSSILDPMSPSGEGHLSSAPLGEEPSPGPVGPGQGDGMEVVSRVEGKAVGVKGEANLSPVVPAIDWNRLRDLATASRKSEDARHEYEDVLRSEVFPRLEDPPVKDRWTRNESVDWCCKRRSNSGTGVGFIPVRFGVSLIRE